MLVLTRRTGQEIVIGRNVRITVTAVRGDRVRLGIAAPESVRVDRPKCTSDAWPPAPRFRERSNTSRSGTWRSDDRIPKRPAAATGTRTAIQHRTAQRTSARVQMPDVEVIGNRVFVSGCMPSYYFKQLVLQAVLDVVGPMRDRRIKLNVNVR